MAKVSWKDRLPKDKVIARTVPLPWKKRNLNDYGPVTRWGPTPDGDVTPYGDWRNPEADDLAESIGKYLKAQGIIVHLYQAFSSDSCYLKFDWGALNGLRVADHGSKYSYRYNVRLDESFPHVYETEGEYGATAYIASGHPDSIAQLVARIVQDKEDAESMWGAHAIRMAQEERVAKSNAGSTKTFWHHARRL